MPWTSSTRRSQLPADWPAIRRRILQRDGHRCRWIDDGRRCPLPATDVDHVHRGNDHRDSNLQSLCHDHHQDKTTAEAAAARLPRRRTPARHPGLL